MNVLSALPAPAWPMNLIAAPVAYPVETYPALLGLVLGSVSPLVIAVIQQPRWSKPVRFLVTVLYAVVVGVVTAVATGTLGEGMTLPATIAAVFVAAQSTYKGWVASGLVPSIENATAIGARSPYR